jgi:hypothetical protein
MFSFLGDHRHASDTFLEKALSHTVPKRQAQHDSKIMRRTEKGKDDGKA